MTGIPAEQAAATLVGALPRPSDLAAAVRVGQEILAHYGDSSRDGFTYPEAYGATREALRILLHALDAEPDGRSEGWTSMTNVQLPAAQRCPAAHPDDPTPCDGPTMVTVLDAHNAGANGCEHHGARLLASLDGGRVYGLPHAEPGTAIRVFKAAAGIRPFCWYEDALRTEPSQLSHSETSGRGEAK